MRVIFIYTLINWDDTNQRRKLMFNISGRIFIAFWGLILLSPKVFSSEILDSAVQLDRKWYAEWVDSTTSICNKSDEDYDTRLCYNTLYGKSGTVRISVTQNRKLVDTLNIGFVRYSKWEQEYDRDTNSLKKSNFIQLRDYDGDGLPNEFVYNDFSDPPAYGSSVIRLSHDNHLEFIRDSASSDIISQYHGWDTIPKNGAIRKESITCGDHGSDQHFIQVVINRNYNFHYYPYNASCDFQYSDNHIDSKFQLDIFNSAYALTKSNALSLCIMDELAYRFKKEKFSNDKKWNKRLSLLNKKCKEMNQGFDTQQPKLQFIPQLIQ